MPAPKVIHDGTVRLERLVWDLVWKKFFLIHTKQYFTVIIQHTLHYFYTLLLLHWLQQLLRKKSFFIGGTIVGGNVQNNKQISWTPAKVKRLDNFFSNLSHFGKLSCSKFEHFFHQAAKLTSKSCRKVFS